MQEKVSVIVPIYNVEKYLRRCVDSLVRQVHKNIEILLIDDCSTDESSIIAREYAAKYPQLCHYIQRDENGGLSAARNTGIEASTGKWLAFVDSDDWVTEDYVSAMYETAVKDQTDIVCCNSYYMAYDRDKIKEIHSVSDITTQSSHKAKVARLRFFAWSKLIKKELFVKNNIKFPEDIWRCEDISTIVPLYTMTKKISIINRPIYFYFQRINSLSNQNQRNVDISFYPMTVMRMMKLAEEGYELELEFRAISELLYGMVMLMVRSGRSNKEISQHIDGFEQKFLNWRANPYFVFLPKGKKIFINVAGKKKVMVLKILIWGWDLRGKVVKRKING